MANLDVTTTARTHGKQPKHARIAQIDEIRLSDEPPSARETEVVTQVLEDLDGALGHVEQLGRAHGRACKEEPEEPALDEGVRG